MNNIVGVNSQVVISGNISPNQIIKNIKPVSTTVWMPTSVNIFNPMCFPFSSNAGLNPCIPI
ncbi:MAG: hypothetical protein ACFFAA_09760, partial [Promethearchaeota archaeon]